MIDTYWQNFIYVFKDTLGKIGSDIQREEGRSIEDIISEKIVTLLGYFNNDYNRDDMVDMEEVSKVYIIALKLIFFLNKNIRDDYFFYDTFKEIIKKEIYMTTNLKFLMDDMYDKIRENKNGFDEHADDLIKIYYDKITEKEEYNELFENFVNEYNRNPGLYSREDDDDATVPYEDGEMTSYNEDDATVPYYQQDGDDPEDTLSLGSAGFEPPLGTPPTPPTLPMPPTNGIGGTPSRSKSRRRITKRRRGAPREFARKNVYY